jgi:hypothetical protein
MMTARQIVEPRIHNYNYRDTLAASQRSVEDRGHYRR